MIIDRNGLLLTEKINLQFLKELEPQFFNNEGYIKFVIDEKTGSVVVGMEIHKDCIEIIASQREYETNFDFEPVWGGNLYYDGHIIWSSTLNNSKNLRLKEWGETPREITNKEVINRLTVILREKIDI